MALEVRITEVQGEPIGNYDPANLVIPISTPEYSRESDFVFLKERAKAALWDAGWTPNTVTWKVYRDGHDTGIVGTWGR